MQLIENKQTRLQLWSRQARATRWGVSCVFPPADRSEEAIMYKGVSFDSVELTKYELGAIVDAEFPFTFDDYEYINSID